MILGIDYGEKWCGVAQSEGSLAAPLKTVLTKNILAEIKKLNPEKIVVGISENKMADQTRRFIKSLPGLVETVDETLTSYEAQKIKKKRADQHAVAAALILNRYLDNM